MDNYKHRTKPELIAEIERLKNLNNSLKVINGVGGLDKTAVAENSTERKQAEEKLRESENLSREILEAKERAEESEGKLKAALGSMTDAIFISDKEGNFIDFNEAFATFHKFKNKEECKKNLKDFPVFLDVFYSDGEFVPLEMWVVSKALRGETGSNKEYILKRKDIDETWVGSYNYSPIRNEEGNIIGSVVTARDITDHKKLQKEIIVAKEQTEESEEKFTSIYEQSPIAIEIYNKEGKLIDVNQRTLDMFGVDDKKHVLGFDLWADPNLSSEKIHLLKNGKSIFLSTDFDFEVVKKQNLYPTKRSGIMYMDMYAIPLMEKNDITGYLVQIVEITERKLAEILLRGEKERIRTILDMIGDPIFVKDNEHRITLANQAFYTMFKVDEKNVIGFTLVEAVPENEKHHFLKVDREVLDTGIPDQREEELTIKELTKTIITRKIRYIDESGEKFLVGSIHDISERKNAEVELSASLKREKNLGDIVRNAPMAIASGYPDGRLFNCNKAFTELTGYSEAELKNINWNMELTPSHWIEIEAEVLQKLNSKNNFIQYEKEYRHKKGTIIPIELFVYGKFDEHNNLLHYIGFIIDITERKEAEQALLQSEEKFKSLMHQSPFIVELYNLDGLQIEVNTAYEELWGFPASTTVNSFNILRSKEVVETGLIDYVNRAYAGESVKVPEYEFDPTGDTESKGFGRTRYLNTSLYPIKNANNEVSNIVVVHQDVTERKTAEEELNKYHVNLEELVKERTKDLEVKNRELERFNDLFVNRELRIKELREQVKKNENDK